VAISVQHRAERIMLQASDVLIGEIPANAPHQTPANGMFVYAVFLSGGYRHSM
jgi:hypothetical protein